jgi:hypothetical protein
MKFAILFAALTIGLLFIIRAFAERFGNTVRVRFFESKTDYSPDRLRKFVKRQREEALRYAFPILFPLDLLFLLCLGGFIYMGSVSLLEASRVAQSLVQLAVILPAIYVICDLIEDVLLASCFISARPDRISESLIRIIQQVTLIKIWSARLGLVQVALIALWSIAYVGS